MATASTMRTAMAYAMKTKRKLVPMLLHVTTMTTQQSTRTMPFASTLIHSRIVTATATTTRTATVYAMRLKLVDVRTSQRVTTTLLPPMKTVHAITAVQLLPRWRATTSSSKRWETPLKVLSSACTSKPQMQRMFCPPLLVMH